MQIMAVLVPLGVLCALLGGGDLEKGFFILLHLIEAALLLGVIGIVAAIFWNIREPVARWYYFTFHPHPAEDAVRSAIASGRLLDGNQLATMLGEVPPGDRIFREVRVAQSVALITAMQSATQAQLRDLEKHAQEKYAQAAVQEAQAALGQAAVALEQAKAMLHANARSGTV